MKNRRLLALLAVAASLSCVLSACNFGGKKPEEQVIVDEENPTPTPEPEQEPVPTEEPVVWEPVYTSLDGSISIDMPDENWSNKTDANGIVSIESDSGKIVVIHGNEADMDTLVLPDSEDMAMTLERAKELEDGEFEILNYSNEDQGGVNVIYYLVKYLNTEKSDGVVSNIIKYISNETEYYEINANVNTDDDEVLTKVNNAVNSFKILSADSPLAAGAAAAVPALDAAAAGEGTGEGEAVDAASASDGAGYTEDDLSDTNRTRTLYSNDGSGRPFVVWNNDDGTWSDEEGNVYRFDESDVSIVYDQNDIDYYYNGEAGDVRYMPITGEE